MLNDFNKNKHNFKQQLDRIFSPCSVAVIGVSKNGINAGSRFLQSLVKFQFKGKLYAVTPLADNVFNIKAYPSILDIPGSVDHVIVCIPSHDISSVIKQCVEKSVNSVAIFTSGFSESGSKQGNHLEKKLIKITQNSNVRIIGPNCMGLYCPSIGLTFRDDLPQKSGSVSFISQSGGMAITSILSAAEKKVYFNKTVSYGNEIDLTASDFLDYFADDNDTSMIMLYIEGIKNGKKFFSALKKASAKIPVVVLKGGITKAGNRAVISHTGALSGVSDVWSAAVRQSGGIQTYSIEEFVDTACALHFIKPFKGKKLGVVTISGGIGVNLTDLAVNMGFEIPPFPKFIQKMLNKLICLPGTGIQNPIDMAAAFFNTETYYQLFTLLDKSDSLDIIMMHVSMEYLLRFKDIIPESAQLIVDEIIKSALSLNKPFVLIIPYTIKDDERKEIELKFLDKKIPVFPTIERALIAINHCIYYYEKHL